MPINQNLSPATLRAYTHDWNTFAMWCHRNNLKALPAEPTTVQRFLSEHSGSPATLSRILAAIASAHRVAQQVSPTTHLFVKEALKNRSTGLQPRSRKPILGRQLIAALAFLKEKPIDIRDRAMFLLGFAGALNRSEIVALNLDDITFTRDGAQIRLRKANASAQTILVAFGNKVKTCPVHALGDWLALITETDGPIFRPINKNGDIRSTRLTDVMVNKRLQRILAKSRLNPDEYSSHGLRIGFAETALQANIPREDIAEHGRWQRLPVPNGTRSGRVHPGTKIGL